MVSEENYDQRKYMGMRKKLLRRTFDRGLIIKGESSQMISYFVTPREWRF